MKQHTSLLIVPLGALAVGILAGKLGAGLIAGGVVIAIAIACFIFVSKATLDPLRGFTLNKWHYSWIFLLFGGVGIIDYAMTKPEDFGEDWDKICFVEGRVLSTQSTTSGDRSTIEIERGWDSVTNRMVRTPGLKIMATTQGIGPTTDDIVRIKSKQYPVKDSENYFSTGYAGRLRNQGILYRTYYEQENLTITGHNSTLSGHAVDIRDKIETVIEKSGLSTPTKHFLITILLGDRAYLHDDMRQLFADGGVSHMLALSGMHVGIIAGIVLWLLVPLNIIGRYKLRLALTLVIMFLYSFLTGMAPSTLRATLMLGALTIGVLLERKNNALNALLFSALVILLVTPSALYDVGFQLSFTCVLALIIFADHLNPVAHRAHPFLYKLFGLIGATLIATMATWTITAYYFGQVPVAFLGANLILLPLLPIFLLLAIIYLCFSAMGVQLSLLGALLDLTMAGAENFLKWLTRGGGTAIEFQPSEWSLILWIVFMCLLGFMLLDKRKRLWGWSASICLCAFVVTMFFTDNGEVKDGLIVQNTTRDIQILARKDSKDEIVKASRHAVSEFNHNGEWYLAIDHSPTSLESMTRRRYKAVILGGNFKSEIENLFDSIQTDIVITHPTMRKKREEEILHKADSLSVSAYSIRKQGAWRHITK